MTVENIATADWTPWVAVYAAGVSTAVGIWNVFTWWRTNRLHLAGYARMNMVTFGALKDGKTYIVLTIENRGAVPTMVTGVYMVVYDNWLRWFQKEEFKAGIVNHTDKFGFAVPSRIDRSGQFMSGVVQTPEMEVWAKDKLLYVGVSHTMSDKTFYVRVKPSKAMRAKAKVKEKAKS